MARTIAKDHDDKRQRILTHAARVFARDGFDRATMAGVAQECRISKANIYHYYAGKDELLFDILNSYLAALRDRVCGLDVMGKMPEARFRATVLEVLLAYQGADDEHRLQINAMAHLPEAQQAVLRGYQRDLVQHMGAVIAAVTPDRLGADRARLRAVTMSVFGMLNWFYMWNDGADAAARADYAATVCDLTLGGVGAV